MGGGIAGLAIAYFLDKEGIQSTIYEMQDRPGGLGQSFCINEFWFDYGGHVSFTKDEEIKHLLEGNVEIQREISKATNYSNGLWIKHPVQNNLAVLPTEEKISIIKDMIERETKEKYSNYYEWLVGHFGKYFARNYPCRYTRKYWTTDAENLETKWIGARMYTPTIEEVLFGAFETDTKAVHYSGEMRYPLKGGFEMFLQKMLSKANVCCNQKVTKVDTSKQCIEINEKESIKYDYLVSTLPLDVTDKIYCNVPKFVGVACMGLAHTSLILVSLGISHKLNIPEAIYIYNEDFLVTRGYSTSIFGKGNAPEGMSTLQLEVYYSKFKENMLSLEQIKERVIEECIQMNIFVRSDIVVSDVRKKEYANIIFTHDIYKNREVIHRFLDERNIFYVGRFAEWDYLWVDQTIMSAKNVAQKLVEKIRKDEE